MRALRLYSIKQLSPLPDSISPIDKALIARRYMAQDWLIDAYIRLVQWHEIISDAEAVHLGVFTAFSLLQLQAERFKRWHRSKGNTICSDCNEFYNKETRGYFRWIKKAG